MSSYLILVKYDHEGPHLDSCLDVSIAVSADKPHLVEAVRRKMGLEARPEFDQLQHDLSVFMLRPRFDGACDGPFLIHAPGELTRDEIEQLLQDKPLLAKIRKGGRV